MSYKFRTSSRALDTKTALRLGENISACGVGMPRADGPQASPVKLPTPTALKPKPPAAVRLIKNLALVGLRGVGLGHTTKAATSAASRALPRRRALCTN